MSAQTGREGEDEAARYLAGAGMEILARNWRTRRGELDIVARDGESLVIVEVKTWPRFPMEELAAALGRQRKKRLVETAKCFIAANRQYNGTYVRFDVVFIESLRAGTRPPRIHHLKDAFSESV